MKRPWPVTVFAMQFILAGSVGFAYHLSHRPFERDFILVSAIRLLAILGGVFLFIGHNWAVAFVVFYSLASLLQRTRIGRFHGGLIVHYRLADGSDVSAMARIRAAE